MGKQKNNNIQWPSKHLLLNPGELHELTEHLLPAYKTLIQAEKIPDSEFLTKRLPDLFIPMTAWLLSQKKAPPLIIGINGPQGAGKSTLAKILKLILEQGFNQSVLNLSIDDLYLTKKQRNKLAHDIHPLFSTRGVPGTHDTAMGISIFKQLMKNRQSEYLLPVFDKSTDDRLPESNWQRFTGNCDIVLFEGWCVGAKAQSTNQLQTPINQLEKQNDPDGVWRSFINQQLEAAYAELFSYIDTLIMFTVPNFNKVFEWRKLQEKKLRKSTTSHQNKTMSDTEIERFIMHFERLTKHTLSEMPGRCDIELQLGDDHQIKNVNTPI